MACTGGIVRLTRMAAATCAVVVSVTGPAYAQGSLPPAVDAFVASGNALAKSAAERVDLGRTTARLAIIRRAVTDKVLAAKAGETFHLTLNEESLLCDARANHLAAAAQRNYLQAVAGKVEEVGKPTKIENLQGAVKSLFASQSVDVAVGIPSANELRATEKTMRDRCNLDFKSFDVVYYGQDLTPSDPGAERALPALATFQAVGALVQAIVGVITPVVVEGTKFIDEEQRRKAVLAFLSDAENVKSIQSAGMALATEVSDFVVAKRRKLVGHYGERIATLRTVSVDPSKNDHCKKFVAEGKPAKNASGLGLNDEFVLCWRGVWEQLETSVAAVLKAADDYDQLADAGDDDSAAKAFDPLSKALANIANPGDGVARLWGWATRLVAFAEKVNTASSKETREKIQKAIDDLVKTF